MCEQWAKASRESQPAGTGVKMWVQGDTRGGSAGRYKMGQVSLYELEDLFWKDLENKVFLVNVQPD